MALSLIAINPSVYNKVDFSWLLLSFFINSFYKFYPISIKGTKQGKISNQKFIFIF